MDSQYLQNIRYKLQKRFSRVNSARWQLYHSVIIQFWHFLKRYDVFVGVLEILTSKEPTAKESAMAIMNEKKGIVPETEQEGAAISYWIVKSYCEQEDPHFVIKFLFQYTQESEYEELFRFFTELFVEPLYEYLDEQLDDWGAILALLKKYKQRAEWFLRAHLYQTWDSNKQTGEKILTLNLYEYLHEQGVDFYIEPTSVSGQADIISTQEGDERLLADAKIFNPDTSHGRDYLARGFKQLYTYTLDFNEPVGYLIIFNTSEKDLRFTVSGDSQSFPFITFNQKTIYLITIDIFPHDKPASKRGKIKPYEITEEFLTGAIEKEPPG